MYVNEFRDGETMAPAVNSPKPQRTIYILDIPGGGVFASLPTALIEVFEDLAEESISVLFQSKTGASGGTIATCGTSIPSPDDPAKQKISGKMSKQHFLEQISLFFPFIKRRIARMFGTQLIHTISDKLDPLESEHLQIENINRACNRIKSHPLFGSDPQLPVNVATIEKIANKRWFSEREKHSVISACASIRFLCESLSPETDKIVRLIEARSSGRSLKNLFTRSAYIGLSKLKEKQFTKDYFYPAQVAQDFYRRTFGETRLSECLGSVYVMVNDETRHTPVTYYSRREDPFDMSPDAKRIISPSDPKVWDLVMASTANPLAYPNHKMEDGTVCSDIATIYTPLKAVSDAIGYKIKHPDVNIKLVTLGTGRVLDNDKIRHDIIDYNTTRGLIGNIAKGKQMEMLHASSMAVFRDSIESLIGKDNILEINPCLSSEDYEESLLLPSHDITDGSKENVQKLEVLCNKLAERHMDQIRPIVFGLIQNCYHLGRMSEEKYSRVARKLGYEPVLIPKEPEPVVEEAPVESNVIQFAISEPASEPGLPAALEKPKSGRLSWLFARLGWASAPPQMTNASNDTARLESKQRQLAP